MAQEKVIKWFKSQTPKTTKNIKNYNELLVQTSSAFKKISAEKENFDFYKTTLFLKFGEGKIVLPKSKEHKDINKSIKRYKEDTLK